MPERPIKRQFLKNERQILNGSLLLILHKFLHFLYSTQFINPAIWTSYCTFSVQLSLHKFYHQLLSQLAFICFYMFQLHIAATFMELKHIGGKKWANKNQLCNELVIMLVYIAIWKSDLLLLHTIVCHEGLSWVAWLQCYDCTGNPDLRRHENKS
jgi:hypothetical protein